MCYKCSSSYSLIEFNRNAWHMIHCPSCAAKYGMDKKKKCWKHKCDCDFCCKKHRDHDDCKRKCDDHDHDHCKKRKCHCRKCHNKCKPDYCYKCKKKHHCPKCKPQCDCECHHKKHW